MRSNQDHKKRFRVMVLEPAVQAEYDEVRKRARRTGSVREDHLHEAITRLLASNPEVKSEHGVRPLLERVQARVRIDSERADSRRAVREVRFHEVQHAQSPDHVALDKCNRTMISELARKIWFKYPELAAYSLATANEKADLARAKGKSIEALRVEMSVQRIRARSDYREEYLSLK